MNYRYIALDYHHVQSAICRDICLFMCNIIIGVYLLDIIIIMCYS